MRSERRGLVVTVRTVQFIVRELLTLSGEQQATGVVMAGESLGGLIGGVLLAAYGPSNLRA